MPSPSNRQQEPAPSSPGATSSQAPALSNLLTPAENGAEPAPLQVDVSVQSSLITFCFKPVADAHIATRRPTAAVPTMQTRPMAPTQNPPARVPSHRLYSSTSTKMDVDIMPTARVSTSCPTTTPNRSASTCSITSGDCCSVVVSTPRRFHLLTTTPCSASSI